MNEDEGGQAEVIWTCNDKRTKVCRKKDDRNGVIGKEEKRKTKDIFKCCERRYGKVDVKEMDVENMMVWRRMIRCGYP